LLAVPATAGAQTGGAPPTPMPKVSDVACRSACAGTVAQLGSVLRLDGESLQSVRAISFLGGLAPGDEVSAAPDKATTTRVLVTVPPGAVSGPVMVTDIDGQTSVSPPVEIVETALPEATSGPIATAVTSTKAFVDGERAPTLAYRLNTEAPADVTVSVVRTGSDKTAATIDQGTVAPGEIKTVSWARRAGSFRFVVSATGDGVTASTAQAEKPDGFRVYADMFPLQAKHEYGDGFGADRGHQGADVFAACDTPIHAARGGVVKFKEFEAAAGNYVVMDETRSDTDSVYMHLRDPALPEEGDRVRTGEVIGYVGDTGDASECHLHFELWSAPGWYSGGAAFDPVPSLKAWDKFS
jgi:murein DD-endopeptidase MepM/ murein hydrolase activator NlpD